MATLQAGGGNRPRQTRLLIALVAIAALVLIGINLLRGPATSREENRGRSEGTLQPTEQGTKPVPTGSSTP